MTSLSVAEKELAGETERKQLKDDIHMPKKVHISKAEIMKVR
jgi:hypothetical protein